MSRKSQTNTTTSIGNATPLIWRVLPVAPYFPAAHGEPEHVAFDVAPVVAEYVPAVHTLHVVVPFVAENVPASQSEHVALADDVEPAENLED